MAAEPTEAELDALMARLADGDRTAFDPLFDALYPRAMRLARAKLGASLADDAAQSTMLKIFDRASEFAAGRPVLPWFYAVASNEIRAIARASRARGAQQLDADAFAASWVDEGDDPERVAIERELRVALDRAVESLDKASAEAVYALLGRGESPQCEPAAFRKRVSRAYARLRVLLGGSYGK